jgi:hypothetical protein
VTSKSKTRSEPACTLRPADFQKTIKNFTA